MGNKSSLEEMVDFNYLKKYYDGKKVLVTGHTGFKGAWLIQVLQQLGATICGYALAPEKAQDLYNQIDGDQICTKSIFDDIRDAKRVQQAIISFEPDFIFHLAAQPLVIESYAQPIYTFEVNTIGTANILEALRNIQGKCVCVCITTDKVYENLENGEAFIEQDRLGGYDPYSASKAAAEIIINSYRSSFFNPKDFNTHQKSVASARAGNVIGGGDFSDNRIIPDIINALTQELPIEIRNPNAVRPWQHVLEPIGGYLILGAKMSDDGASFSQAYNFGPEKNDALPVKQLVEMAIATAHKGEWIDKSNPNQKHEAQYLMLDIEKAKSQLNWKPIFDASTNIKTTIDWYLNDAAASIKCEEDINKYFNKHANK
jgi:CDP-glucose 4,6-dehydratase